MIDLKTCTRADFIKAYTNLESAYKHLESEVHYLNDRLQEYEGIQTKESIDIEVEEFLAEYGIKRNRKQVTTIWKRLSKKKKAQIKKALPLYKKEFPDKKFRVTPDKYLRHEKYNDEYESFKECDRPKVGARALNPMKEREKELNKLREDFKKVNIKERLGL